MDPKIHAHNILLSQNRLIASIRGIVSSNMVDVKTGGKSHATLQIISFFKPLVTRESSHAIFDALGNFGEGLARLDVLLSPLSNLSMSTLR